MKAFQKDHGLYVDGVVGPMTWDALDSTDPAKLYTVTIPHLTYFKAEALVNQYPGASLVEEKR